LGDGDGGYRRDDDIERRAERPADQRDGGEMTTVLVAVDETEEAIEAVRTARALFGAEADYVAVNVAERAPAWTTVPVTWGAVFPLEPAFPGGPDDRLFDADDELHAAKATAEEVAGQAGVEATTLGEVGDPASAIIAAAETSAADVIVVGSSRKGWWRRLLQGSVSEQVLRESPIPVLLVGRAADDE